MPKSQTSHSTRFSDMRITESPPFTPASISADATDSTSRRIALQLSTFHASPARWWMRARSPYFAACRKKTPTVVRSEIPSGSIPLPVSAVVLSADVLLLQSRPFRGKESSGACPAAGRVGFLLGPPTGSVRGNRQVPSHYLTALMVKVSVPDGTLTVTLSPFFFPTSARPTGESTEMRPADGSLSTAPTR